MPNEDTLAFKTPTAAKNMTAVQSRQTGRTTPGVMPTTMTHATVGKAPTAVASHATTATVGGKAADDKILPVFAGGVPKNNPIAGTGRDSLVGASGVGGVIVKATAGTPKTPYVTGSLVGVGSPVTIKKPIISSGGKISTTVTKVPPNSTTGGSTITPKVGSSSPISNPDQGGGVGGISPATNTGGGFPWTSILEIGALAAVAFLLVIYLRQSKRRK